MTLSTLVGVAYFLIGAIHGIWTVSATIRAFKTQWPVEWPISGRWVLAFYSFTLTLIFFELSRFRLSHPELPVTVWELMIRGLLLLGSLVAMWRWASGNMLGPRDDFE